LSALCKAVSPAQVQVTYCAGDPLPFRVEWSADLGAITFAGPTPDAAAERALSALRSHAPLPVSRVRPEVARVEVATEPVAQPGWAEAMRERIRELDERATPPRRPNLRLVRGNLRR
jgi:hypothetical protein